MIIRYHRVRLLDSQNLYAWCWEDIGEGVSKWGGSAFQIPLWILSFPNMSIHFHCTSFPFPSMTFKVKDFPNPKTTKYASISHFIYKPHGAGRFTNHFPNLSNIECPTILSFIPLNHLKLTQSKQANMSSTWEWPATSGLSPWRSFDLRPQTQESRIVLRVEGSIDLWAKQRKLH